MLQVLIDHVGVVQVDVAGIEQKVGLTSIGEMFCTVFVYDVTGILGGGNVQRTSCRDIDLDCSIDDVPCGTLGAEKNVDLCRTTKLGKPLDKCFYFPLPVGTHKVGVFLDHNPYGGAVTHGLKWIRNACVPSVHQFARITQDLDDTVDGTGKSSCVYGILPSLQFQLFGIDEDGLITFGCGIQ